MELLFAIILAAIGLVVLDLLVKVLGYSPSIKVELWLLVVLVLAALVIQFRRPILAALARVWRACCGLYLDWRETFRTVRGQTVISLELSPGLQTVAWYPPTKTVIVSATINFVVTNRAKTEIELGDAYLIVETLRFFRSPGQMALFRPTQALAPQRLAGFATTKKLVDIHDQQVAAVAPGRWMRLVLGIDVKPSNSVSPQISVSRYRRLGMMPNWKARQLRLPKNANVGL